MKHESSPLRHSDMRSDLDPAMNGHPKSDLPDREIRVLVADDDGEFCSLIGHALRNAGFDVTLCLDGITLADYVGSYVLEGSRDNFDLIVSDIRMPGLSGLQVLEGMNGWTGFPPMILMTAFGDEKVHAAAERLGAAAMLDKPFELDTLLTIAKSLIAERVGSRPQDESECG